MKNLLLLVVFLILFTATLVRADNFTVVTPYCGTEENIYTNEQYGLKLKDSQTIAGLYLQSVNTEKYQWNFFLYQTNDINYSNLTGINFIYDYYFGKSAQVKKVVGVGVNYLQLDLAGKQVPALRGNLDGFDLNLEVSSFYFRIGKYYNYGPDKIRWTLFPWIGGQQNYSNGDGLVDYPGPGTIAFKINDDQYFWIAGLNLKADYRHFLQVEVKHAITFNQNDCYHKTAVMVNFFMTKKWGLSYRYNYQETDTGNDSYNIFGVAAVF